MGKRHDYKLMVTSVTTSTAGFAVEVKVTAVVSRLPQNVSDQELRALLGMTFVPYLNEEK